MKQNSLAEFLAAEDVADGAGEGFGLLDTCKPS
jgi:hypothetical protein